MTRCTYSSCYPFIFFFPRNIPPFIVCITGKSFDKPSRNFHLNGKHDTWQMFVIVVADASAAAAVDSPWRTRHLQKKHRQKPSSKMFNNICRNDENIISKNCFLYSFPGRFLFFFGNLRACVLLLCVSSHQRANRMREIQMEHSCSHAHFFFYLSRFSLCVLCALYTNFA